MGYIDKIGYEIEGLWYKRAASKLLPLIGGEFVHDGSIYIPSDTCEIYGFVDANDFYENTIQQEYRSYPRRTLRDIKKDLERIKKHFLGANESCGFHIHVSFKSDAIFSMLSTQKFVRYFIKEVQKQYPDMFRIRKESDYCKPVVPSGEDIIRAFLLGDRERYRAVNLNACHKHHTIEFRIFDMDISNVYDYIKFTVKVVEKYIQKNKKLYKVEKQEVKYPIVKQTIYV